MNKKRFYIHCGDDINKQLMDTESDFNIHVEEIGSDEELIRLCNLLNKQQATIDEQKIIIEERDAANERLNRFLIEIGLEKEYIKWEFKKRCVE